MGMNVKLVGTSTYLPGEPIAFEKINEYIGPLSNASPKIQKWMERIQPVMKEMLGIEYCHYAFNNKTRSFDDDFLSMAVKAAKLALEDAGLEAKDIDLLVFGGAYSHQLPPLSTRIQEALGIDICGEFHIHSNCTSVYKAIKTAHALLKAGEYKNALVVSSHVASSYFIPEFYNQEKVTKDDIFLRWYLCDGAGAFVLSAVDEKTKGFFLEDSYIESAGGNKASAMCNDFTSYSSNPLIDYDNCAHHIRQIYLSEMREHAVDANDKTIFYNALKRMIDKHEIDLSALKYFVVNMPSKSVRDHIINECADMNIGADKCYSAIEQVGYAGPPAAIISIDTLLKNNSFKDGDLIFSFVMEVSKFMQAGFTIRYVA